MRNVGLKNIFEFLRAGRVGARIGNVQEVVYENFRVEALGVTHQYSLTTYQGTLSGSFTVTPTYNSAQTLVTLTWTFTAPTLAVTTTAGQPVKLNVYQENSGYITVLTTSIPASSNGTTITLPTPNSTSKTYIIADYSSINTSLQYIPNNNFGARATSGNFLAWSSSSVGSSSFEDYEVSDGSGGHLTFQVKQ